MKELKEFSTDFGTLEAVREFIDDEAPAGYAFAVAYRNKTEAVREKLPNCIVVPGFDALQDYLKRHTWCMEQCLEVYPWSITNF